MATFRGDNAAFGAPGGEPRWAHGDKDGVGTAYSASSLLWYTIWNGIVTELYYPTVDHPQTRDLQYLFSDGESFFHQETRYLKTEIERLGGGLGYRLRGEDPEGRYRYTKEIIADPHAPCLLQHTRIEASPEQLKKLKLYALLAPHIEVAGCGNNGYVARALDRELLVAERNGIWLAMMASHPFSRLSAGYVGQSDGWTDLAQNFQMDWQFDRALDGNIALMGEIDLSQTQEFTLGVAFGNSHHRAVTTLFQSLAEPFEEQARRFEEQWQRTEHSRRPLQKQSFDGGNLYEASYRLLLAHEDKLYQGAMVASLAIPWGEAKGDQEGEGGYHLVWTRDMVQCAMGLLAAGNTETPLRALIYLGTSQLADGSFAQNFWVNGQAFWSGIQLDEVAFPILLAHRLQNEGALKGFDPYPLVMRAAGFLVQQGPATKQERWEEVSGYSPSTIAAQIAALLCAASLSRTRGDEPSAVFLEQFADWLEHNLETWTVTRNSTLLPGVATHYVRLNPSDMGDELPDDGLHEEVITLTSRAPGENADFAARDIVDGGFLELVRYGVRRADDPIILDTLKVIDATLRVETESGVCWRRYNNDNYGQQDDGSAYVTHGRGRGWPLLTGERGHYELALGRGTDDYVRWMEGFATPTQLLPEQVWDADDLPDRHLKKGRPTGSAVPLLWAHAEYTKLLRSREDGKVFDLIPQVAERYITHRQPYANLQFWAFQYPAKRIQRGHQLRIMAQAAFRLRWSVDAWQTENDTESSSTNLGLFYADIEVPDTLRFTFLWLEADRWEGRDFEVVAV